jgi:hypothetical protein
MHKAEKAILGFPEISIWVKVRFVVSLSQEGPSTV